MNSNIISTTETKPFPKLMRFKEHHKVVLLMTTPCNGTVVATDKTFYPLGQYSKTWVASDFQEFKDVVELSNY